VQFTDLSFGYPDAPQFWSWNFDDPNSGDLNTSQEQNPSHIFSGTGFYDVTLTVISDTSLVEGSNGYPCLEDEITIQIIISGSGIGIEELDADWNAWFTDEIMRFESTKTPMEVEVYDVNGRRIYHSSTFRESLFDCKNLAVGVYVVALRFSDVEYASKRIVKFE
jgi:hypothetical protein